jgi:hypothetical protein
MKVRMGTNYAVEGGYEIKAPEQLERAKLLYALYRGSLDDNTAVPTWDKLSEPMQAAFVFVLEADV